MCGIVGAIGAENTIGKIIEGLKRLEYRGYDSAGISVLDGGHFKTVKQEGKIVRLEAAIKKSELKGFLKDDGKRLTAIGHTRWATHGRPSEENSHPHASSKICVVHNGIIENYQEIKEKLTKHGAHFLSETDSEVVPHLLEENLKDVVGSQNFDHSKIRAAIVKTLGEIHGSYGLAMMLKDYPQFLVVAKKGSPLLIGMGEGENYIASDYHALADYTNKVVYLNDGEFAFVYKDKVEFFDEKGGAISREIKIMENLENKVSKGDFAHFMLKEIYEQPKVLADTIQHYVDLAANKIHLPNFNFDLKEIKKITMIACGTSYYSASLAKYLFEEIAQIEVEVDIASEFRYRKAVFRDDNLMVFISQSGETADTIAALKYAKENGQKILSIVNVAQSSMAELSDAVIKTVAGPEIGVASTKAYVAQLCVLSIFAIELGRIRGKIDSSKQSDYLNQLAFTQEKIEQILQEKSVKNIKKVAKYLVKAKHVLYVGRGVSYVSALESALKLRELSYIDAQAIAAGELKHGTIALIDKKMPVIAIAPSNNLFEKIASNIEEIRAREGKIILVSDESGAKNMKNLVAKIITIPDMDGSIQEAIVGVIAPQLLAYYVALYKGNDVDQPRNLAKSVTVE